MSPIQLQPQESFPEELLKELTAANLSYTKTKNFPAYKQRICALFKLTEPKVTTESRLFLAGFLEGEASMNVSIKKLDTATFGVLLDPEFNITQHVNGVEILYLAMCVFQTGRITKKSGSKATLVYKIDNRQLLLEKVLPFYDDYVIPYGALSKKERKKRFLILLQAFNDGKHKDPVTFINEMLPLWDSLRMQKGQKNETFSDLEEAIEYIEQFLEDKEHNQDF